MVEGFNSRKLEIPRTTEGELPEAKIFDLLSSVGNGENKALELILMKEGVTYSMYGFYQEVMNHQTEGNKWRMGKKVTFDHCERSLSPIGLVTREALRPNLSTWGYQITEYGLRTGVPFAGLLLKWSYEHPNYSLYRMFGATASKSIKEEQTLDKKRAQETRYKVFREVFASTDDKIRPRDIANAIDEKAGLITPHFEHLRQNGIISYIILEHIKPNRYPFEISVSKEQREAIVSLISSIDNFRNGDRQTIEEGRRFAQRVANDPHLFSELMLKAKEASSHANRADREDIHFYISTILEENPNSTKRQIQQLLEKDYSKKLTRRGGLQYHLSSLIREGKIISEKTKSGNVYRLVEDPDSQ